MTKQELLMVFARATVLAGLTKTTLEEYCRQRKISVKYKTSLEMAQAIILHEYAGLIKEQA